MRVISPDLAGSSPQWGLSGSHAGSGRKGELSVRRIPCYFNGRNEGISDPKAWMVKGFAGGFGV